MRMHRVFAVRSFMAKKRKSDASRLDEVDRTMYTTFCSAANSLSQLYTQAMNQQKLAFQAGERHAMVAVECNLLLSSYKRRGGLYVSENPSLSWAAQMNGNLRLVCPVDGCMAMEDKKTLMLGRVLSACLEAYVTIVIITAPFQIAGFSSMNSVTSFTYCPSSPPPQFMLVGSCRDLIPCMEKLYQWILKQHEEGSRVSGADVIDYLQNELEYGGEDSSMSPRLQQQQQQQQQHSQPVLHFTNSGIQATSGSFGQATVGQGLRSSHADQTKNSVFSNALSSPVRRSLQPYHFAQGGYCPNNVLPTMNGGATRSQEMNFPNSNRESNSLNSNDSSMDMHADSPSHEPY
ncbi:hypothetical protein ACLOJK_031808 [Asimina triloba]